MTATWVDNFDPHNVHAVVKLTRESANFVELGFDISHTLALAHTCVRAASECLCRREAGSCALKLIRFMTILATANV